MNPSLLLFAHLGKLPWWSYLSFQYGVAIRCSFKSFNSEQNKIINPNLHFNKPIRRLNYNLFYIFFYGNTLFFNHSFLYCNFGHYLIKFFRWNHSIVIHISRINHILHFILIYPNIKLFSNPSQIFSRNKSNILVIEQFEDFLKTFPCFGLKGKSSHDGQERRKFDELVLVS